MKLSGKSHSLTRSALRKATGIGRSLVFLSAVGLMCAYFCTVRAGTLVQFRTVLGEVEVELFDQEKPITTQNFLRYLNEGAYRDSFYHRAEHNFVIQGGGYAVANRGATNAYVLTITNHPPITNEFNVPPFRSNVYGTIAMAKTSDPNSATSEFFFNLNNNSVWLDNPTNSGGFTVFGQAISGSNVLAQLNTFSTNFSQLTNLTVNAGGAFKTLPVLQISTNALGQLYIDLKDLIFVDISTLQIQVEARPGSTRAVSWNSVPNTTNWVEYTTVMPPAWEPLTNFLGNGARLEVIDTASDTRNRFYRVRVP
jgi:cyclophilin family peptidyl-prolyl cis-trans isomerase